MESISSAEIPFSLQAEQSVIGSVLLNPESLQSCMPVVKPTDFYVKPYAVMYEALIDLYNQGKPIDIITFSEHLKLTGQFDSVGGIEQVTLVVNSVPTAANVAHYAAIVYEKSVLRQLIKSAEEIAKASYSSQDSADNILDFAEQSIFDILNKREIKGFSHVREVLSVNFEKLCSISESNGELTGIPTGFADLDRILSGLHRGNMVLIAARPAMGKTSFALNIVHSVSRKTMEPVAIFSLEMSKEELVNRLWSLETSVELARIQTADMSEHQWLQLAEGMELLSKLPIYIDDSGECTVAQMKAKCRRLKSKEGLSLVVIDHMQLMQGSRRTDNRQSEVSEISRMLKLMAKDLDVPVVVLSQLNRSVESRVGNRPALSDLRESGAIEQDADVVMLLYRDDYYNKETDKPGIAECNIAKHRNGSTGLVELKWLAEYTKFAGLEKNYE